MEYVWALIALVVGFWAGWRLRSAIFIWTVNEHPEKFVEALQELSQRKQQQDPQPLDPDSEQAAGVELAVEQVGNTLYAYRKASGEFVAQGTDWPSVLAAAHSRYPETKFFGNIAQDKSTK